MYHLGKHSQMGVTQLVNFHSSEQLPDCGDIQPTLYVAIHQSIYLSIT